MSFLFSSERNTFLKILQQTFTCISMTWREFILILNVIIGKGEWDYHNWFRPVVLKLQHESESPGGLIKIQIAVFLHQNFWLSILGMGPNKCAFLISCQVIPPLSVWGSYFGDYCFRQILIHFLGLRVTGGTHQGQVSRRELVRAAPRPNHLMFSCIFPCIFWVHT